MSVNEIIIALLILYNLHELNISLLFSSLITIYHDALHTVSQYGSLHDAVSHYSPSTAAGDMYLLAM
jgi:hypothetical protein